MAGAIQQKIKKRTMSFKRADSMTSVQHDLREQLAIQKQDFSGDWPSKGSTKHFEGECRRCCFYPKGSCKSAENCDYCHFNHSSLMSGKKSEKRRTNGDVVSSDGSSEDTRSHKVKANLTAVRTKHASDLRYAVSHASEKPETPERKKVELSLVEELDPKPVHLNLANHILSSISPRQSDKTEERGRINKSDLPRRFVRCPMLVYDEDDKEITFEEFELGPIQFDENGRAISPPPIGTMSEIRKSADTLTSAALVQKSSPKRRTRDSGMEQQLHAHRGEEVRPQLQYTQSPPMAHHGRPQFQAQFQQFQSQFQPQLQAQFQQHQMMQPLHPAMFPEGMALHAVNVGVMPPQQHAPHLSMSHPQQRQFNQVGIQQGRQTTPRKGGQRKRNFQDNVQRDQLLTESLQGPPEQQSKAGLSDTLYQ